jgi:hypothetical protein
MSVRAKTLLSIVASDYGCDGGMKALVDADDANGGISYGALQRIEPWPIATTGPMGAAFVALPGIPSTTKLLHWHTVGSVPVACRLNGTPAKVTGVGASFGTIAAGDGFGLLVDGGGVIPMVMESTDTTLALVVKRINALAGAQVVAADVTGTQLVFTGVLTGGQSAQAQALQFGQIAISAGTNYAKFGLTLGTSYGGGYDCIPQWRSNQDLSTTAAGLGVTKIEFSGNATLTVLVAG